MELSFTDMAVRLVVATIFSGLIGIEREMRHKPAGVRTNALIGLGAATMTLCGVAIAAQWPNAAIAPDRIASIVVQGIGFLGAGAIIQAAGSVHGLTTAATMWVVAGIGIASGFGLFAIAGIVSIIVLILLVIFGPLDYKLMGEENGDARVGKGILKKLFEKK